MTRVVHFEILADDIDRASEFYKTVFGWKIEGWGDEKYYLINTGDEKKPGINGALMPRSKPFTDKGGYMAYVCTVEIEGKVEDYAKSIEEAGGSQVTEYQDIPGVGRHAYFKDTEGNVFGLMQPEKK